MSSIALYLRVSTADQDLAGQEELLVRRARAEGRAYVVFRDPGYSGGDPVRRDYAKLKRRLEAGEFGEVWVTRLDRLGRSTKELLEFYDLAERVGARVVVTEQGIDTGTAAGRLLRTVLAAMAEFERELIRHRVQGAMDQLHDGRRRTRSGRPVGRPPVVTAEKLARIRELRGQEPPRPWKEVAQEVGLKVATCQTVFSRVRHFINRGAAPPVADPPCTT